MTGKSFGEVPGPGIKMSVNSLEGMDLDISAALGRLMFSHRPNVEDAKTVWVGEI